MCVPHTHTHAHTNTTCLISFPHLEKSFCSLSLFSSILNAIAYAKPILTGHSAFIKSCLLLPFWEECPRVTGRLPLTGCVTYLFTLIMKVSCGQILVFVFISPFFSQPLLQAPLPGFSWGNNQIRPFTVSSYGVLFLQCATNWINVFSGKS